MSYQYLKSVYLEQNVTVLSPRRPCYTFRVSVNICDTEYIITHTTCSFSCILLIQSLIMRHHNVRFCCWLHQGTLLGLLHLTILIYYIQFKIIKTIKMFLVLDFFLKIYHWYRRQMSNLFNVFHSPYYIICISHINIYVIDLGESTELFYIIASLKSLSKYCYKLS